MKKQVKKLDLKKRTLVHLCREAQQQLNGGASVTCVTIRICPTPPESLQCPTSF